MRVKRLDLFGFKSFATKTSIQFEHGVTAIVGPNGSGKSNIVDAVRWVLGEHNPRDVRAPRLEDIIFNGTDTKAPLSMAEVSLLLDNDRGVLPITFTEVLITRRIYRSGESECFMNHSPCRLRDIQELFLGTGLGGGTYAIITQGHIDLVLSSKPEERRIVFEEASGVAKYLAKKQETTRRLDEAEEHLLRLVDILSEVKRQLSALERQANKARQYKSQWDQLKAAELRLAVNELRHGQTRHEAVTQDIEALKAKRHALDERRQKTLASLESFNAQIATTHVSLQDLRARVVESASRIEQHTQQRGLKAGWIEELLQQRQQLDREVIQLDERVTLLQAQAERLAQELSGMDAQRQEMNERVRQTREALSRFDQDLSDAIAAVEQSKKAVYQAGTQSSQCRSVLAKLAADIQGLEGQRQRAQAQQQSLEKRLTAALERRQQAQAQRTEIGDQERQVLDQLAASRQSLDQATAEREELMGRLRQSREQLLQEQAKAKFLDEMAQRNEGFPEAVKALVASQPDGVLGLLADLLDPEAGFEQALEAALGGLTTAIVVRDRQALRLCKAALASQQFDHARFIVLSDCPLTNYTKPVQSTSGHFIGMLKDFVRHDPMYAGPANWLLGRWAVTDDIISLLDGFTPGLWVSKSGDRWDGRSWRFIGVSRQVSRMGLTRRLEQARQDAQGLGQQTEQLQQQLQQADAGCQALGVHETALRDQLERIVPSRARLDGQMGQLSHEISRLEEELKGLVEDAQQWEARTADLVGSQERSRQVVAESETTQHDAETMLRDAQRRLDEINQRRQQDVMALTQLETSAASQNEQVKRLQARRDEIHSDSQQATAQLAAKRQQADSVVQKREELTRQLDEHEGLVATLTQEQSTRQAELDQMSSRLSGEERARDAVLPSLLEVEQTLASVSQSLDEQLRQASELDFRRARVLERLREVYHIDDATLVAEEHGASTPLSEEDRQALAEQVQRLKAKVETAGPVSLGSVEEYDELAKRSEFLKTQHEDLVKSRDDLRASIAQINRNARAQFRETFVTIRQEFQGYFTKLFNGGQADLILLNEEDILDSGIEIVARPPGKRLQSISLLSGGERAITALALLFALFKVKPSPFCILDEIDAPLDEANVDRFTGVLEEFLNLSQFILITHNKKTITKADSLYGVTMEQPGISKLVSVKLKAKRQAPTDASKPPEELLNTSPDQQQPSSSDGESPTGEPIHSTADASS